MKKITQKKSNLKLLVESIAASINEKSSSLGNGYSRSLSISENDYQTLFNEVKAFWDSVKDGTNRFGMNVVMWNDAAEHNSTDTLIGFLEFSYPSLSNPSRPGLYYALEEHDDGFERGFSATKYYGDSDYSDQAMTSAFKSIFRALGIPFGKLPNGSPEQRIRKSGELFDWNLKTSSEHGNASVQHEVHEADKSNGGHVHVTCMNPDPNGPEKLEFDVPDNKLEDWMKKWNVNATYQELQTRMIESDTAELQSGDVMYFYLNQP